MVVSFRDVNCLIFSVLLYKQNRLQERAQAAERRAADDFINAATRLLKMGRAKAA